MTFTRSLKLLFLFGLTITPLCRAQQAEPRPPGPQNPEIPLELTIRQTSPNLTVQVELKNTGKEPLNLERPNGVDAYAVGLQLIDEQGKKRWLSQRIPNCDEQKTKCHYVGILPVGYPPFLQPELTYTVSVDLRNFDPLVFHGVCTLLAIYAHDFSYVKVGPWSRETSNSLPITIAEQ